MELIPNDFCSSLVQACFGSAATSFANKLPGISGVQSEVPGQDVVEVLVMVHY
jgi:hypothetical protein